MEYLRGHRPDVILTDIDLGPENGIDCVRSIQETHPECQVIFVSGHIEFCTAVYEVEHLYFLPKPINETAFGKAIAKAKWKLSEQQSRQVSLKIGYKTVVVSFDEIRVVENARRKLKFILPDRTVETYMPIEELYAKLDHRFNHCHKSYIVNMDFIKALEPRKFILKNGVEIPIAPRRYTESRQKFLQYLGASI
jgi:DNA-binding LytR/AlgR family response regulator